jgi:microcystin-dependent protein
MDYGTLGEIRLFAGTFAPSRWAYCDGRLLPISNNQALFSILGSTFGGDGRTNFALPNLKGKAPDGISYVICTEGSYPSMPE